MSGAREALKNGLRVLFGFPLLRSLARNTLFVPGSLAFPPMVQIEITNACNARCTICPHEKMTREIGNIDEALFRSIIDECARNRQHVRTVLANHFGEPFLNPRLTEYIKYIKERLPSAEAAIFSNASLISEDKARALLESGLDLITISFDGFSKKTYEGIRRNLDFDAVNANINRLLELREQAGRSKLRVELSYVEVGENTVERESFISKWKDRVNKVNIGMFCNWGGAVSGEEIIKASPGKAGRKPCTRLWSHLLVFRNGDVPLCCQDYDGDYLLGNVAKSSVKDVWQGAAAQRYRRLHAQGRFDEIPICRVCNFWKQQNEPIWWW